MSDSQTVDRAMTGEEIPGLGAAPFAAKKGEGGVFTALDCVPFLKEKNPGMDVREIEEIAQRYLEQMVGAKMLQTDDGCKSFRFGYKRDTRRGISQSFTG